MNIKFKLSTPKKGEKQKLKEILNQFTVPSKPKQRATPQRQQQQEEEPWAVGPVTDDNEGA
jgi:hypothetical protein